MAKGSRICCVCHREHIYCPVCNPEDKTKPSWYFAYCSGNCKDIYEVTSGYENGEISANEAKNKLDKLDLSRIEDFGESYKNSIDKINENFVSVQTLVKETKSDADKVKTLNKQSVNSRNKNVKTDDVE